MFAPVAESASKHSLLHAVDIASCSCNLRLRLPLKVNLWLLWDRFTFLVNFFLGGRLVFTFYSVLLFKGAFELVTIFEVPDSLAFWFVILEFALEVDTIGVDPLAILDVAIVPVSGHLHACLLEGVGTVALLLAVLPPA